MLFQQTLKTKNRTTKVRLYFNHFLVYFFNLTK
ncbi:hypothetical protein HAINFHK1212_1839, partial [Haemophilus influenzae HK1212]